MDITQLAGNQNELNQHDPKENYSFSSKSLTPEERSALRSIQREASIYRGYPLALVLGGLAHIGLRKSFPKMSLYGRLGLTAVACACGNVVGKVTYIPTAMKRLEETLPHDSQLWQMLNKARNQGELNSGVITPNLEEAFSYNNPNVDTTGDSQPSNTPPAPRTYEGLRRSHREKERSGISTAYSPVVSNSGPLPPYSGDLKTESSEKIEKKIRYNKYGDPIIE